MLILLPSQIRSRSLPDLLASLDPGVSDVPGDHDVSAFPPDRVVSASDRDRARLDKTVGFTDSLLRYRIFQRYGKCLLRSLILFLFLRAQGWPVEIHFGVRKTGKDATGANETCDANQMGITGHSWLVKNGELFLEEPSQEHGYATTYTYPVLHPSQNYPGHKE